MKNNYILYTDGGSRGNPGPAAIGGVLYDASHSEVASFGRCIGITTNNQAEYQALIHGMTLAAEKKVSQLECRLDSELVVKQLNNEYKVKDKDLAERYAQVVLLRYHFKQCDFKHIPRASNKRADFLVNQALDGARK